MPSTESLFGSSTPVPRAERCRHSCRRLAGPHRNTDHQRLAGDWQVIASLGAGFVRYGRRPSLGIDIQTDGSLRFRGSSNSSLALCEFWPFNAGLSLIWRNEAGDECIIGRPARGQAIILSRSGEVSNEALFKRVNLLRSQGFSLEHLTVPH